MDRLWVVGDLFQSCAALGNVVTISEMLERVAQPQEVDGSKPTRLGLGQGLSCCELNALEEALRDPRISRSWVSDEPIHLAHPCESRLVHKRNENNVMLTTPHEIARNVYGARLRIDDACDDMADHQTGYHLAGALLAEAARQLTLAVSELFLLPVEQRFRMQFVTHTAEMSYHTYAFPFGVDVSLTVIKLRRAFGGSFRASVAIEFEQNSKCVANVSMLFSAMEGGFARSQEGALARLALGGMLP